MVEYYYTAYGVLVPKGNPKAKIKVEVSSAYSYAIYENRKRDGWKQLTSGSLERISAMFERLTCGVKLQLGTRYLDALGNICSENGAVWKVDGETRRIAMPGGSWVTCNTTGALKIVYYDKDKIECGLRDAVEAYTVLPYGNRVRLTMNHTIDAFIDPPFKNKRHFLNRDFTLAQASDAYYRLLRVEGKDKIEVYTRNLSNWVMLGEIWGFHIKTEIPRIGLLYEKVEYLDSKFRVCSSSDAVYTKIVKLNGVLERLYSGDTLVCQGTPADIKAYMEKERSAQEVSLLKPAPTPEPITEPVPVEVPVCQTGKFYPVIVEKVWSLISETTHLEKDDLRDYLFLAMWRNRACKSGPVFNSRLTDMLGQDIYLADTSYNDNGVYEGLRMSPEDLYIVMYLEDAKKYAPGLKYMPAPLQWASNVTDYVWNPTIPLHPLNAGNIQHICVERKDRLPEELQSLPPTVLIQAIKQSVEEGARKACTDMSYALPCYSREHDSVGMMLPVRVPILYGDRVICVALLAKSQLSYNLCTIITNDMARKSVQLFTDVRNTWLKGETENA